MAILRPPGGITRPKINIVAPSLGEYEPAGIYGTDSADVLNGTDQSDWMEAYDGDDQIYGHLGNDQIEGGWGADYIDGGDGEHDRAWYDDSPEGVIVDLAFGRGLWGHATGDTLVNIEDLVGSMHNDVLIGNDGANILSALDGDDRLVGGGGADYLGGHSGRDTADYTGSGAGVVVNLQTGRGFGGDAEGDVLDGIEDLLGSSHGDTLIGSEDSNNLLGEEGNDMLKGGGGADTLEGYSGDDTLKGGGGADTLIGGTGTNTASYNGSAAGVFVSLKDHVTAHGDAAGDVLYNIDNLTGSGHADEFWGDHWANVLDGAEGNDILKGYGGADTLFGGAGNDHLDGMLGADAMAGGFGADTFVWGVIEETGVTLPTMDRITDFNFAEGDRIHLALVDANIYAAGDQAFSFIGQAAFTGAPGEINYVYVGGDTIIQLQTGIDVDIEGGIRLSGLHTPEASWFEL